MRTPPPEPIRRERHPASACLRSVCLGVLAWVGVGASTAPDDPELYELEPDLELPPVLDAAPAPGTRVRLQLETYAESDVHHVLYLPTDWEPGRRYPLIVEYAGNGGYANELGDTCSGRVEDACLGYGISGGEGVLWLSVPFVGEGGRENALRWWGDFERSVDYLAQVVPAVCAEYGGDPEAVLLAGFSRGALACNVLGLHDERVSSLWAGFVCHSHYDGVRRWPYEGDEREAAAERLERLAGRPQWISHERSVDEVAAYLDELGVEGDFTLRALPFPNHTDAWVLRDVPLRAELRAWVASVFAGER